MYRILLVICAVALLATACGASDAITPAEHDGESAPTSRAPPATSSADEPASFEAPDSTDYQASAEAQQQAAAPSPSSDHALGEADPVEERENVDPEQDEESSSDESVAAGPDEHPGPVTFAIADLSARLGIDESAVEVVTFEAVTWPDTSLGCPDPKRTYMQVLVDGSLIVLEVSGVRYEYHTGQGGDPFYCAIPTAPVPGGYGDT